jgi:DUF1365 family protein
VVTGDPQAPWLYDSVVTHSRRSPLANRFRYKAWYWLVDIDHLPQPRGWLRFVTQVRDRDHIDVRSVLGGLGVAADRVLMLTSARTLGYVFNPITVFWCYDRAGTPTMIVAEVHNTYGDRHAYLLRLDDHHYAEVDKAMYVSPFYPVDGRYGFEVADPDASLSVTVTLQRDGEPPFVATLRGRRQEVSAANVLRSSLRYPSARTSLLIRRQGIRLWRRGLKVYPR